MPSNYYSATASFFSFFDFIEIDENEIASIANIDVNWLQLIIVPFTKKLLTSYASPAIVATVIAISTINIILVVFI